MMIYDWEEEELEDAKAILQEALDKEVAEGIAKTIGLDPIAIIERLAKGKPNDL